MSSVCMNWEGICSFGESLFVMMRKYGVVVLEHAQLHNPLVSLPMVSNVYPRTHAQQGLNNRVGCHYYYIYILLWFLKKHFCFNSKRLIQLKLYNIACFSPKSPTVKGENNLYYCELQKRFPRRVS